MSLISLSRSFSPVSDPPLVSVMPNSIVANQTDVINVVCEMFGIPTPELTWTFSSGLSPSPPEELSNGTFISIVTIVDGYNLTSYFTINSARHTDTGVYTCSGDNGILNRIDSPEEDSFELLIQGGRAYLILCIHMYMFFNEQLNSACESFQYAINCSGSLLVVRLCEENFRI